MAWCRTWSGWWPRVWCRVGCVYGVYFGRFGRMCPVDALALVPVAVLWAVLSVYGAGYSPEARSTGCSTPHLDRCCASCGFHQEWAYPLRIISLCTTSMLCCRSEGVTLKYVAHLAWDGTSERSVRKALAQWRSR